MGYAKRVDQALYNVINVLLSEFSGLAGYEFRTDFYTYTDTEIIIENVLRMGSYENVVTCYSYLKLFSDSVEGTEVYVVYVDDFLENALRRTRNAIDSRLYFGGLSWR